MNAASPRMAADDILEAAVSFADLDFGPEPHLPFSCPSRTARSNSNGTRPIGPAESVVPEPAFEKLNWKAWSRYWQAGSGRIRPAETSRC